MRNSMNFLDFFFHRRFAPTPPQVLAKNSTCSKRHSDTIREVKKLFKIIRLQNKAYLDNKYSVSEKLSFWLIPEGE